MNEVLSDLDAHYQIYLAGQMPIINTIKVRLQRDVPRLILLALLVILLVFYFSFKSKRSVLLPLIVVSLGTVWTLGLMSLLGFPCQPDHPAGCPHHHGRFRLLFPQEAESLAG